MSTLFITSRERDSLTNSTRLLLATPFAALLRERIRQEVNKDILLASSLEPCEEEVTTFSAVLQQAK
jgi:hypothetical protein